MSRTRPEDEPEVPPALPVRGLIARLTTSLLGYDAFVSHAHADSLKYAERLVRLLDGRNCYLDREENQAGDHLRSTLTKALRRSRVLIIVASPGAVRSRWVKDEWSAFQKLHRRTIVIDIAGACSHAPWMLEQDPVRIQESTYALESGNPSQNVVDHILHAFTFTSRATLAHRILGAGTLAILTGAGLSIRFGIEARANARLEARQRHTAEQVLETFVGMAARADPFTEERPSELKMMDALIAATQRDFAIDDFPAVEGRLRLALGRSLSKLGAFDLAKHELEVALARLDEDDSASNAERIDVRNELSTTLLELGRYEDARARIDEAQNLLGSMEEAPVLPRLTSQYLALWLAQEAQDPGVEERVQALIENTVSGLGDSDDRSLCAVVAAADVLLWNGDLEVARALVVPALEGCELRLGLDHPCSLDALRTIAWLEYFSEDYERAVEAAEIEHDLRVKRVGSDHPESVWSLRTLACAHLDAGNLEFAEPLYREALSRIGRNPVPMQWRTGLVKRDFARLLFETDRPEKGLVLAREAVADLARTRGESHLSTISAMDQCAEYCLAQELEEESLQWVQRAEAARALQRSREERLRGR